MNKKKAIVKFAVISLIIVLGLVLCFVDFRIPFTDIHYDGCYNAIKNKMGIDLNGGVLAVYDAERNEESGEDLGVAVDATIRRIENLLSEKGYLEATVTKQRAGDSYKIRIEVPGMDDTKEIMQAIGTPANIEFAHPTTTQGTTNSYNENDIFMSGHGIKDVDTIMQNDGTWAVRLHFTEDGTRDFRNAVSDHPGEYLSIYSNGKLISSPQISSENASSLGADGTVLITGNYDSESAESFALQIKSGLYSVKLNNGELSDISATLGEGAVMAGVISLLIGLVLIFIIMYVVYRDFGLLANLSLLVYTIIFLFLLAIIDSIQLTLPGIAGIILSIGMAVDANILIFEQIKEEYQAGKRLAAATHAGFNHSVWTILDANITTIIVSLILFFLSDGAIKGFAITLALGVAISMFTGLVITRSLAKLYLYINPDNVARVNIRLQPQKEETPTVKPAKRKLNMGGVK